MPAGVSVGVYPKQRRILTSNDFIRGFVTGRGGGKTWTGALDVILSAKHGDSFMAVSPSYVVLEDTTWPTFREVAEMLGVWIRGVKSPIPRAHFVTRDGGHAEVVFRSGENPDSLRGPSKAGLWLDEASIMHEDVLKYGIPVLRHKGRMGKLLLTMTPRGRAHWTFDLFYDRLGPVDELIDARGTDGAYLLDDPRIEIFQNIAYKRAKNTRLVQAHSNENPFLPSEFVERIADQYSQALAEQELAGQFVDLLGLLFERPWFRIHTDRPQGDGAMWVRYWDRAIDVTGQGSQTAGCLMARTPEDHYIICDIRYGNWNAKERDDLIETVAEMDAKRTGNTCMIHIEQEGGSAGHEIAMQAIKRLGRFPVYSDIVSGKRSRKVAGMELPGEAKVKRAMPVAAAAEAGNVSMLRGNWNADTLDQLTAFPESKLSDIVDSISGAYNKLSEMTGYGDFKPGEKIRQPEGDAASRFGSLLRDLQAKRKRNL